MKKCYAVVYLDDNNIELQDVFDDYLKSVGATYCRFTDMINNLKESNYELIRTAEFYTLEGETGFGWTAYFKRNEKEFKITYYLLDKTMEEE